MRAGLRRAVSRIERDYKADWEELVQPHVSRAAAARGFLNAYLLASPECTEIFQLWMSMTVVRG